MHVEALVFVLSNYTPAETVEGALSLVLCIGRSKPLLVSCRRWRSIEAAWRLLNVLLWCARQVYSVEMWFDSAISRSSRACAGFCNVHWSQQTTLCLVQAMARHRSGLVVIHLLCFCGVFCRCILWKCGLSARLEVTIWEQIIGTDVGTVHS